MLATQVEYWKLQESKRHNLADEAIHREANDINWVNADSGVKNASANLSNASTNIRNAATNERNAATNERNARVNERNAEINAQNAESNRMQAEASKAQAQASAIQAEAATKQAENSALQAAASWKNAESQAKQTYYNTEEQGFLKDLAMTRQAQKQANLNEEKEITERTMRPVNEQNVRTDTAKKMSELGKNISSGITTPISEVRHWIESFTQ